MQLPCLFPRTITIIYHVCFSQNIHKYGTTKEFLMCCRGNGEGWKGEMWVMGKGGMVSAFHAGKTSKIEIFVVLWVPLPATSPYSSYFLGPSPYCPLFPFCTPFSLSLWRKKNNLCLSLTKKFHSLLWSLRRPLRVTLNSYGISFLI